MEAYRGMLWAILPLALSANVVSAQSIAPGSTEVREEAAAKALLAGYYRSIPGVVISSFGPPPGNLPDDCTGTSLVECFGGDPECTPPFGRGRIVRHCESEALGRERDVLLSRLDSLSVLDPESDWIAGQRVYLAIKNGNPGRAIQIAETCRASTWWCQALLGFSMHMESEGPGGRHFRSALGAVAPDTPAWDQVRLAGADDRGVRCEWTDLTPLIPDSAFLAAYRATGACGERQTFEERFWWLADPFWSVPGNERFDEHVARNVQARWRDETLRVAPRDSWTDTFHRPVQEVAHTRARHDEIVRLGPWNSWRAVGWSHEMRDPYTNAVRAVYRFSARGLFIGDTIQPFPGGRYYVPRSDRITYERYRVGYLNGGYRFTPDWSRFEDPLHSTAEDWALTWNEGHERMLTSDTWYNLDHQTGVLLRGDSLLVITAGRAPVLFDSLNSVDGALAMGRPTDMHIEVAPAQVDIFGVARGRIMLSRSPWVASLELTGEGWRGRARHGAAPPQIDETGFGVSAPLFIEERTQGVEFSVDDGLIPSSSVGSRDRIGLYLELYGVAEDEPLEIRLTVTPSSVQAGLLQRTLRALRFWKGDEGPLQLSWSEPARLLLPDVAPLQVALDARSLQSGSYRLEVEVQRASGAVAESSTELRIDR